MGSAANKYRFLFAGGGTGGHLFPAIAVAQKILSIKPEAEILFVGTSSKIEGSVVPKLGFNFSSIWISGFSRSFSFKNILFPFKLIVSLMQSILINMKFKPKVAIGSGGYVSGPAIFGANVMGARIILLEQNVYPGVTTRLLEKYAEEIHLSFEDSKRYFKDPEKIKITGNPIREDLKYIDKNSALKSFELPPNKKTILILGGSLGAKSINEAICNNIENFKKNGIQIIWQTGKYYIDTYKKYLSDTIKVVPFIEDMNSAYSACDLVISRAGGITITEIMNLGIPSILIPSPNVAENHQYLNAKNLFENKAALFIEDSKINMELLDLILNTISDDKKLLNLKNNSLQIAKPEATKIVAERAIKLADE